MSLVSDVVDVLRNPPVSGISFKIDAVSVNKDQMAAVAEAIEKGDIAVAVGDTGGLGAAYSSFVTRRWGAGEKKLIGEIKVRDADVAKKAVDRAGIFHESVHALKDVKGLKLSMHEDEVVAYLADALYLEKTMTKIFSPDQAAMAIYDAARKIIATHKMKDKPGVVLKWTDCAALRDAIKAHPAYH